MTPTERWIRDETAKLKICKVMYPTLWESYKIEAEKLEWYPTWGLSDPDRSRMLKRIDVKEATHLAYSTLAVNQAFCDYEELLQVYQFLSQSDAIKVKASSALLNNRNKRFHTRCEFT